MVTVTRNKTRARTTINAGDNSRVVVNVANSRPEEEPPALAHGRPRGRGRQVPAQQPAAQQPEQEAAIPAPVQPPPAPARGRPRGRGRRVPAQQPAAQQPEPEAAPVQPPPAAVLPPGISILNFSGHVEGVNLTFTNVTFNVTNCPHRHHDQ